MDIRLCDNDIKDRARKAHPIGFLEKPVMIDEIAVSVERMAEKPYKDDNLSGALGSGRSIVYREHKVKPIPIGPV